MPASSVTGVGPGSADGKNKGSEHQTLATTHLIGTRVITAGRVALSGGAATVKFPVSLERAAADYIVIVNTTTANAARLNAKTDDSSSLFASFTIAGTGTDTVQWAVINIAG